MATKRVSGRAGSKGTFIQASRAISAEQKALYHDVTGAGMSRVMRKFFELDDSDIEKITALIDEGLARAVNRAS
jgi:hypothetical protein